MVENCKQYSCHRKPIVSIKELCYLWKHSNNFLAQTRSFIIKFLNDTFSCGKRSKIFGEIIREYII